jgi:aerobic carbon-monoxide dehydrogenase medium subunit
MADAHPSLPEFDYIRPATLAEASQFLVDHPGDARPFSGGTDTFVRMRDGVWTDHYLVDVKHLEGTSDLAFDSKHGLLVGAGLPMNALTASPLVQQHYPLLAQAVRTVAAYQLRNRATVVGNICNASPAGDAIGACLAYEGNLIVYGPKGRREEPLATFFKGPGKTVLGPGDIALALRLPVPPNRHAGRYLKLGRNRLSDLAIVGVTALAYADEDTPSGIRFRLALAAVAPIPLMAKEAEEILAEGPLDDATITRAAESAMQACSPIDDVRGSARYRRLMVRNLTRQAIVEVLAELS